MELHLCENHIFFLPVNILMVWLGLHDTLLCVLISMKNNEKYGSQLGGLTQNCKGSR